MSTRRLAAILAADVVGYSRLMGADEEGTLERLKTHRRELIDPKIAEHRGRIVKTTGDGMLVEFASAVDAARCAVEVQRDMAERSVGLQQDKRIEIRIGIHVGDIIIDDDDIFGDGVNIAARLEGVAEPGGITISGAVHEQVRDRLPYAFEDGGEQSMKNIARPVRVYRVRADGSTTASSNASPPTTDVPLTLPDKPSIAVLPFQNMSGDAEQEYFADGIVEDIISALSRTRSLFVIAPNSTFMYRDKSVDVRKVHRELNVRYAMQASIRRSSSRIRIACRLLDAASANHLWSENFDAEFTDIFTVQDTITARIVSSLVPQLGAVEIERAQRKTPASVDAWDLYLRALPVLRIDTSEANADAIQRLHQSIALAPSFAPALAKLSSCHTRSAYNGWGRSGQSSIELAFETARQALAIDPNEALAHEALASAHQFRGDMNEAIAAAENALALNPTLMTAHGTLITALAFQGRSDEAIAAFQRSEHCSPIDPDRSGRLFGLALAHFVKGNYREAVDLARQHTVLRPNWYGSQILLASACALMGRHEEAAAAARKLLEIVPKFSLHRAQRRPIFSREQDIERLFEGLARAGVPQA